MLVKKPTLKSDNYEEIINSVRQLQLDDRVVYDKANRAFVSYIQAYTKYECNLILRVKGQILISSTTKISKLFSNINPLLFSSFFYRFGFM